jgi:hypothetical protein
LNACIALRNGYVCGFLCSFDTETRFFSGFGTDLCDFSNASTVLEDVAGGKAGEHAGEDGEDG